MLKGKLLHHFALAVTALFFFLSSVNFPFTKHILALSLAVLIGTFFIYRLSVWIPVISTSPSIYFYNKPNNLELVIYLITLPLLFCFLQLEEVVLLSGWGLFSTCYFLNIKSEKIDFRGLRSIPFIKTFHLSLLWTIIGYIFKIQNELFSNTIIYEFTIRFIIIFLICLGVDLRDITKDQEAEHGHSIVTLATYLGFQKLKQLMLIINLLLICYLALYFPYLTIEILIASLLFFGTLLLKINSTPSAFTSIMDGLLMLYAFLIFMMQLTHF
jgi:hypothetical protein